MRVCLPQDARQRVLVGHAEHDYAAAVMAVKVDALRYLQARTSFASAPRREPGTGKHTPYTGPHRATCHVIRMCRARQTGQKRLC